MTKEESRAVQSNMEANKMEVLYGTCSGVDVHTFAKMGAGMRENSLLTDQI